MGTPVIGLIAGLGNPGSQYAETRHNAGFWFLQALQQANGFTLQEDKRYKALTGSFATAEGTVRVIAPQTFMNLSGDSVVPFARFFRIDTARILVAYDELDLAPGVVRLKLDGGHGGHNGLRDIMQKSGARDMKRLRIGIGHPGRSDRVSGYVLSRPPVDDRSAILGAIDRCVNTLPDIIAGEFSRAMNILHSD
jgi:PTH1 family peptidyl-tRNA hydrolase